MSMEDYRRMAAKIDHHMRQLAAEGATEAHVILHRMMGYMPHLQKIWHGATDLEFRALSDEFPGFYRFAFIMEEAVEGERRKISPLYDGMQELSEPHKEG